MKNALVLLLFPALLAAASLSGTVKDPQARPVPGATVTLFSPAATVGQTTTDTTGAYRFDDLPAGTYLLRAEASGFAPFLAQSIQLAPDAAATRDLALDLAGVRQQVVVTASSTPQAPEQVSKTVTAIDQADADARDAVTLADVVALAPGIRVNQLGGPGAYTSIRIRGLRDQDTAVLVDGLRLRDASGTQADASGLIEDMLFTNAGTVEVMRGSGSSLYGTDAIGGVVNIITQEGGGRTRGSVLLEGGSLGTFRGRAQLSGGTQSGAINYSLGIAETDVTAGIGGDQPFRDTGAQGSVSFRLAPSVRLIARFYGADSFEKLLGEPDILGNPSGLGIVNAISGVTFTPAPVDPDYTRAGRFVSAALMLNGQATPALDYSASYQLIADARRYGNGPAGAGPYQPDGSTRSLYDGRIQTADAQLHYRSSRFNLLSGGYEFESEAYAYDYADASDPSAASATNVTQRSHAIFAQDQAQFFGGNLQLSASARAQFFALNTPAFFPIASAPYQGMTFAAPPPAYTGDGSAAYYFRKSGTKLRAHVGRGYRAPSLYERFGAGFDPIYGYSNYGDPRLSPEHSLGLDAGVDQMWWHGRIKTSATYFYTWLENVIAFNTVTATDPYGRYFGYLNTQGGISRGFELSAEMAPARSLKINTAYTYVDAIERTPIVGDVLRTFVVPRNEFSIVALERPTSRLLLTCDTLATSSYLAPIYGDIITQTYRFAGIHKVNLGASYRIPIKEYQAIRFFVRAENIFNQTYFESGFFTPGHTATGGLQFEF